MQKYEKQLKYPPFYIIKIVKAQIFVIFLHDLLKNV